MFDGTVINHTDTDLILLHDGTFEGLLTAIFDSYLHSPPPVTVADAMSCQQILGCRYIEIIPDREKSGRVTAGIRKTMGRQGYESIWQAFLYAGAEKHDAIYRYVRLGMKVGRRIEGMLADDRVLALHKINGLVGRESMLTMELLRFSALEGGIYYSAISPEHAILPGLMPHFAERMNIQPFIIHDVTHGVAGVYDRRDWYITSAEEMALPPYTRDELEYRVLWKTFYDTIAIKERINPNLRRQHMPKKYWKNIIEMQPMELIKQKRDKENGKRLGAAETPGNVLLLTDYQKPPALYQR